jgi:hypothetical protein
MQRAGRMIVLCAAILALIGIVVAVLLNLLRVFYIPLAALATAIPIIIILSFYPAVFGGLLWIAGWIVEGFGTSTTENKSADEA